MDIEAAARRIASVAEDLTAAVCAFDEDETPEAFAYADRDDLRTTPGCNFGHGSRTFTLSGWTLSARFRAGFTPHALEEIVTPDGERFGEDVALIVWRFVEGYAARLPWVERGRRTSPTVTPLAAP